MGVITDQLLIGFEWINKNQPQAVLLLGGIAVLSILYLIAKPAKVNPNAPPHVPAKVPFLGNAIEYGIDPIKFLTECKEKYGNVFTFTMMGREMTFCVGPDGNHFVFNIPLASGSAAAAYQKLTTPVFGPGVVYDVDNSTFMEQKKFIKDSLTTAAFRSYVPLIRQETLKLFSEWKDLNRIYVGPEMAKLTMRTATRCLMGKEVYENLYSGVEVSKVMHDLDRGLAPINVFFSWLPLPNYFARDRGHRVLVQELTRIIRERRDKADANQAHDLLEGLMDAKYRNGEKLDDKQIAYIIIGTLMGGQHTSSSQSTWILFELARRPDVVEALLEEQSRVLTGKPDTPPHELPDFTYEQLREMPLLECIVKESLRLHPPIHTMMRKVMQDVEFQGYTIPQGHFLCGAPSVSQLDPARFPDPARYEPSRFMGNDEGAGEWTINGVDIAQKSARSHFLPFGAGRHRCIGEAFGYLQIKTVIATFVRQFQHELLVDEAGKPVFPDPDYTTLITNAKRPAYIKAVPRV